jgi:hypothetical protein
VPVGVTAWAAIAAAEMISRTSELNRCRLFKRRAEFVADRHCDLPVKSRFDTTISDASGEAQPVAFMNAIDQYASVTKGKYSDFVMFNVELTLPHFRTNDRLRVSN